jgi:hypothetical protein
MRTQLPDLKLINIEEIGHCWVAFIACYSPIFLKITQNFMDDDELDIDAVGVEAMV